jgi:hypothetical protein
MATNGHDMELDAGICNMVPKPNWSVLERLIVRWISMLSSDISSNCIIVWVVLPLDNANSPIRRNA